MLIVSAVIPASAGTLEDFEKDAVKKREPGADSKSKKKSSTDGADDFADTCINGLADDCLDALCTSGEAGRAIGAFFGGIANGGRYSWDRINPDGLSSQKDERIVRRQGEALIPFLRLDRMYQEVEADVAAWDYLMIVGYGSLGFQVRSTVYEEKEPADKLRFAEYHALYRMSLGNHVEVDLGAGAMVLKGVQENSGFSVTVPVLIHPSDHYGFEFRPVWSSINENDIQDFDVAFLFGWRYASVKAGYRWVRSPHQSLDGPEMGVSLRW
jgi:hypothetical protein